MTTEIYDYPGGKAKSKVWKVFGFKKIKEGPPTRDNLDMSRAFCRLCQKSYVNKGNTTNFMFHIDHEHASDCNANTENAKTANAKTEKPTPKQQKLSFSPVRLSKDRQTIVDDALLKLLVGKVLPLSLVDNPLFKSFVQLLDPRYSIPCRKVVTQRLEKKRDEIQAKIKSELVSCDNISITHDGWTSLSNESYDTVTAHFIDGSWNLKAAVLETKKIDGRHTSENIAASLRETQHQWNFKSPLSTTDNAANERKAFEILDWVRFGCFGHRINLIVKNALGLPELSHILAKGRKLVTFFHSSPSVSGELLKKQRLLLSETKCNHKLIIDVATRWNSTLAMLQRLCELTPAILALLASDENLSKTAVTAIKNYSFSFEDQARAEHLITVLHPFKLATEIMCSETVPTMHKVLPVVLKLSRSISDCEEDPSFLKAVKKKMREELEKRTEAEDVSIMGCVLNPYTKNFEFMPNLKSEAHELLKKMAMNTSASVTIKQEKLEFNNNIPDLPQLPTLQIDFKHEASATTSKSTGDSPDRKKLKAADTEDWLDDVVCVGVTQEEPSNLVEAEVTSYLNSKVEPGLTVLQWWKANDYLFPRLSKLAKKYLSCQASSVPCERVFSLAGQIVSKKRCRISPEMVDTSIFLNKNMNNYW